MNIVIAIFASLALFFTVKNWPQRLTSGVFDDKRQKVIANFKEWQSQMDDEATIMMRISKVSVIAVYLIYICFYLLTSYWAIQHGFRLLTFLGSLQIVLTLLNIRYGLKIFATIKYGGEFEFQTLLWSRITFCIDLVYYLMVIFTVL